MVRRNTLQTISAALIAFTALTYTLPARAAAKPPARPNIIVIFTDDQTYGAIGYNNPAIKTPRLDALAASGIRFERAYVASPICAASRASMMTGLFPQQHVYPTVLDLAGAPAPPQPTMGKSLLPLFKNPATEHRDTVFCECVGVGGKPAEGHRMARGDRWKLILSDTDEEFLFDEEKDPCELTNRAGDPECGEVLERLRGEMRGWMKLIGDRGYPDEKGHH